MNKYYCNRCGKVVFEGEIKIDKVREFSLLICGKCYEEITIEIRKAGRKEDNEIGYKHE